MHLDTEKFKVQSVSNVYASMQVWLCDCLIMFYKVEIIRSVVNLAFATWVWGMDVFENVSMISLILWILLP